MNHGIGFRQRGFGFRSSMGFARPTASTKGSIVSFGTMGAAGDWAKATTAGNLGIAFVCSNGTISAPTGWTLATPSSTNAELWYKYPLSADEPSADFSSSGSQLFVLLAEVSGTTSLDRSGLNSGQASSQSVSATANDAGGGEVIASLAYWNGSNTGGSVGSLSLTDGTGANALSNSAAGLAPAQTAQYYAALLGVAGTATPTQPDAAAATLSVFSNGQMCIASFK